MDEILMGALAQAGETLALRISRHLAERGYPSELLVAVDGERAVVGSVHEAVRRAETGCAGTAPCGVMEAAARSATSAVIGNLAGSLREALR